MVANMEGFAEPMETFIFPAIDDWENPPAPKYEYSLALAEAAFLEGGFADWDSDDVMEYSPGHDGNLTELEDLPTFMGWIRSDDPDRTFAGIQLRSDLLDLGVSLDMPVADRSTCYYHAWVVYDYHVYTGGWSWRRVPDMYCELWHSSKDNYPSAGGDNYNRYHNQAYDVQAWGLKTAATPAAAEAYANACQIMLHRDVACIPTYTHVGYTAHRTNYGTHAESPVYAGLKWEGFVNELGVGFANFWTYLNAHPQSFTKGGTLRQGLLVDIEKWSPVHAEWFFDWLVLDRIYESLIAYHPYNITEYVPVLTRELPEVLTWTLDGETCTRLRFTLDPLALWHDLTPVTLDDVGFSFTYMRDEVSVANYYAVQNFHDYLTEDNASDPDWDPLPGPGEIDILYNVESWLAQEWVAGVPIIPKHIWEGIDSWTWNPEDHDAVIGTGPFMCYKDEVVGRPDHMLGNYAHLVANPYYYRKYVWPDVTNPAYEVRVRDGYITRADYIMVLNYMGTGDPRRYPLLPPWPAQWIDPTTGDHYLDVDGNGVIDTADLLEFCMHARYGHKWPPPWYVDC
jgi:ABC-type transport system substrate-binding protein